MVVVAGGDDELFAQLQATEWHHQRICITYVTTLPLFMKASDLIISKAGGLIVTEALACGKPLMTGGCHSRSGDGQCILRLELRRR